MNEKEDTFRTLIRDIGENITLLQLIDMKKVLLGHMNKESIDKIHNGNDLITSLIQAKLIGKNKLAFLCKMLHHVDDHAEKMFAMIDHYREKTCVQYVDSTGKTSFVKGI